MSEHENQATSTTGNNQTGFNLRPLILVVLLVIGGIWYFGPKVNTSWVVDEACTKIKSEVYNDWGEVAQVSGEVIYKKGQDYIVAVQYKLQGSSFQGSYACHVYGYRKNNCYVSSLTTEMPYAYDYEDHIDELKALWELD